MTFNAETDRLAACIIKNASWLVLGIIGEAFATRLASVDSCDVNPDEAAHVDRAPLRSWREIDDASRTSAHPPLFILVLHFSLGRTELILRLPVLIGGTVAL